MINKIKINGGIVLKFEKLKLRERLNDGINKLDLEYVR